MSLTLTTELIATSCWCGIPFAIPKNLHRTMHDDGHSCYCPNGHSMSYRESYKDELAAEQSRHDQTKADLKAQRAATTKQRNARLRIEKRIAAGVCPCCNRTFQQLARHMKTKHAEYVAEHGIPKS
jgi:Zn finger protein HypA/HybF involved in hydrogenase expression